MLCTLVTLCQALRGAAGSPNPVTPSVNHGTHRSAPWPGPACVAQCLLHEPQPHLPVPACLYGLGKYSAFAAAFSVARCGAVLGAWCSEWADGCTEHPWGER